MVFHGRTDEAGECKILAGKAGTYRIVEIEPANGYERSEAPWQFLVSYDGTIAGETTLYNEKLIKRLVSGGSMRIMRARMEAGSYGLRCSRLAGSNRRQEIRQIHQMVCTGNHLCDRRRGTGAYRTKERKEKDDEA